MLGRVHEQFRQRLRAGGHRMGATRMEPTTLRVMPRRRRFARQRPHSLIVVLGD